MSVYEGIISSRTFTYNTEKKIFKTQLMVVQIPNS